MIGQSIYQTYRRFRTLQTNRISSLPIVILMPHSACNCRCVMCDIWKDNKNLKQLHESDIIGLLHSLCDLGTKEILMSGGEAILNPNFFRLCEILKKAGMKITLLSTGLTLAKNAEMIAENIDEVIVSIDGPEQLHNEIRNINGAFDKLKQGIAAIRRRDHSFRVTSRTVIHRLNFRQWLPLVISAKSIGINKASFLPADVSSHAFNREVLWSANRQQDILVGEDELEELQNILGQVITWTKCNPGFIAENELKLRNIGAYYSAFYGHNPFPYKKCNAPWVSTVIEADGTVRHCFFHTSMGNIRNDSLKNILNSEEGLKFRRELDMDTNDTCKKCVCYLNLSPTKKLS